VRRVAGPKGPHRRLIATDGALYGELFGLHAVQPIGHEGVGKGFLPHSTTIDSGRVHPDTIVHVGPFGGGAVWQSRPETAVPTLPSG
jgi:hypothetical protein